MARTVNEIFEQIKGDKLSRSELSELNSTSQTSLWMLFAYLFAIAAHLLEKIFDSHKVEINDLISVSRVHSGKWYQQIALNFQFHKTQPQVLIVSDTFVPQYEIIDDTKKIITRATVRESSRSLYIKVNKGVSPDIDVLTTQEMSAFTSYMQQMRDAGTKLIIQSFPTEKLILKVEVDYSPKLGEVTTEQMFDIADNYLSNLDWDGVVDVQRLEAAFLSDPRIVNVKLVYILATQNDDLPIFELYNLAQGVNNKSYSTVAGHIVLNRKTSEVVINAV